MTILESSQVHVDPTSNKPGLQIGHGLAFVTILAFLLWVGQCLFEKYGNLVNKEYSVEWREGQELALLPAPMYFTYDTEKRQLRHRGPVDEKSKLELMAIFPSDSRDKWARIRNGKIDSASCSKATKRPNDCINIEHSYRSGIESLAYKSTEDRFGLLISLLLVAGAVGAIGSHVRSMTAFVNHKSKRDLDLTVWWPYYYVRPFYGAAFGMVIVTIIKAGFLTASSGANDPTLWWISIAFFAGFGDRDFAEKLRQIIKAIFGERADDRERVQQR